MAVETKNKWFLNPRINRLIGVWQDRLFLKSAIQTVIVQNLTFLKSFWAPTYRVLFFQFFKGRVGWEEAWIFIHVLIMNANRLIGVWQDRLYFKSALQTDNYPCSTWLHWKVWEQLPIESYIFYLTVIKGEWVGGDMTLYIENDINIYVEQTTFSFMTTINRHFFRFLAPHAPMLTIWLWINASR